jgi:hypothetical protein
LPDAGAVVKTHATAGKTPWKFEIMNRYQRLSPHAKLRIAIGFAITSFLAAIVSSVGLLLYMEKIPVSETSAFAAQNNGAVVEFTMVDSPNLSNAEISIIAQSMATILANRQPEYAPHLRVVAYGAGTPIYAQLDGGLAGYLGDMDIFIVDVTKARAAARRLKLTPAEGWSFIMGHEASHLVQQLQGRAHLASRGDAYYNDPLEREAFQEGFDLVSAMRAAILRLDINGNVLVTSPFNPYTAEQLVNQNPKVKAHRSWTWRGQVVRAFRSATQIWQ